MDKNNYNLFELAKAHKWTEFYNYLNKDESNIDVNIRDEQNNYLITYAIIFNKPDVVKLLIEKGARIDIVDSEERSVLFMAIKFNFIDIIKLFLLYNKSLIGISILDIRDRNQNILLHYAIILKNLEIVKLLLENGSNPNLTEKNGYNSLHLAIYSRNFDICELIFKHNIDVNAKCNTGESALHLACNLQLTKISALLVANGIDVNLQDYNHDFTALHYAVNLNNKELIQLLLQNNSDPNIQDMFGNTPLHYCLLENNYEVLVMINTLSVKKYEVNYSLWNIDGKIPLHIILEQNPHDIFNYLNIVLSKSNLNVQDNTGTTCLHLICLHGYWKDVVQIISKKKLDIFIPNTYKKRPIDFILDKDLTEFIKIVTDSYIYRLKNARGEWENEWENMCKTQLMYESLTPEQNNVIEKSNIKITAKTTDVCRDLVYNKLMEMTKSSGMVTSKSFPNKAGSICLKVSEGTNIGVCTFTGTTLDIILGLIYILKKHPNTCSTLSKNFNENKELCKFYKSMGIIMNTKCEFLNFEIVWVHQKLHLIENFYENFRKCNNKKEVRFVIVPIGIELREGSHANYLIYDKENNEIERFEPHGANAPLGLNYNPNLLDDILEKRFQEINENIKYVRPKDYLPKVGFQLLDIYENKKKKIGDPGGFCALWVIWYVDMRLTYSNLSRDYLVHKMIKIIRSQNISFKNMIRNYAKGIITIRDKILTKANMDINDWLNDEHTDKQINIVVAEIRNEISKLHY
jgi:ankyrin repeat protein